MVSTLKTDEIYQIESIYESRMELLVDFREYLMEKKAEGYKIIACLSHEFIPDEIIRSMKIIPVYLIFAGDEDRTSIGSGYLTPSMCPFALSQIGAFEDGNSNFKYPFTDIIDGILSTNYCTADTLVCEWLSDKHDLKEFHLHIPYLYRSCHIEYFSADLKRLIEELEDYSKNKIDLDRFKDEITQNTILKSTLSKILKLSIPYSEKNKILQICRIYDAKYVLATYSDYFNRLISNFSNKPNVRKDGEKDVILIGASFFIGDTILDLIEESGGHIFNDNSWLCDSFLGNIITKYDIEGNPIDVESIINLYVHKMIESNFSLHHSSDENSLMKYVNSIEKLSQNSTTKAIINHIIKFCDITGHHRQELKRLLNEKGYQVLNLERDYSRRMQGQLRTRVEAFIEMIED